MPFAKAAVKVTKELKCIYLIYFYFYMNLHLYIKISFPDVYLIQKESNSFKKLYILVFFKDSIFFLSLKCKYANNYYFVKVTLLLYIVNDLLID